MIATPEPVRQSLGSRDHRSPRAPEPVLDRRSRDSEKATRIARVESSQIQGYQRKAVAAKTQTRKEENERTKCQRKKECHAVSDAAELGSAVIN